MAYQNLITINGVTIHQPSKYVGLTADVVETARDVKGVLLGGIVRSDVAKVEADFNYLTAQEWATILQLFDPKFGGSFTNPVTFFNQVTATWETREMYIGDRTTAGAFMCDPETGAVIGWKNPHLSLIEV